MEKTLKEIIDNARSKGYEIDTRPFALNIIGVRNSNPTDQKTFDDLLAYFYYDNQGKLVGKVVPATTDPSTYWLEQPMNTKGAAILQGGQYKDSWEIGIHRGKYEALVQTKPVTVIRDNDRNSYINYFAPTTTGIYGINIHRATIGKDNVNVIDKDSAGCQVFQNKADFDEMMSLAKVSKSKYGNKFSYSLLDERDIVKFVNTTGLGFLILGIAYFVYIKMKK